MFEITIKGTTADEIRLGVTDLAKLLNKINPEDAVAAMMAPVQSVQPQIQTPAPNAAAAYQAQQPVAPVASVPVAQQPAAQPQQQAPAITVPTTGTPVYTQEQIAVAATQLMDAGKRNELIGLLQQFGVQALTQLPKEQYGAFATALRGLGAKI